MNIKIYQELDRIIKSCPGANKHELCELIRTKFGVAVTSPNVEDIDNAVLERYFTKVWQPKHKKYKYSGLSIVDEINSMNLSNVLDIGCGYNEFKGKINNLVGIDAYNNRADHQVSLLDYQTPDRYQAIVCFGSINFGSVTKIIAEMRKAVTLATVGGLLYFRVNPGIQHDDEEAKWIDFFEWTPEFIYNISRELNCDILSMRNDANRIYFVLKKG
jgi:hypothetical protein